MSERVTVPDEYYTAIGRIASGWAHFELVVNHALWELANVHQHAGACITAQIISPTPRFKALVALLSFRGANEAAIKKINSLSGTANDLAEKRNRIVHDSSAVHKASGQFSQLRITADRKLKFDFVPVEMEELKQVEDRIRKLISEIGCAIQDAMDELPAYDKTQFELSAGIQIDRRHGAPKTTQA